MVEKNSVFFLNFSNVEIYVFQVAEFKPEVKFSQFLLISVPYSKSAIINFDNEIPDLDSAKYKT